MATGRFAGSRVSGSTGTTTGRFAGSSDGSSGGSSSSINRNAQLGGWSQQQRANTQELLRQAGYLPRSYVPSGSLDQTFVNAYTSYMNDRNEGASGINSGNISTFARQYPGSSGSSGGRSGGRGGGGGGSAPLPTYGIGSLESSSVEDLRDRLIGYYEQITGASPDAPSLEWVTNQALGKKSVFDIKQSVQATPEFKTRYPNMPAGMDVKEYDSLSIAANAEALDIAGRPIRDDELALLFSDKGDELYDSLRKG